MSRIHLKAISLCFIAFLTMSSASAAAKMSEAEVKPATAWIGHHMVASAPVPAVPALRDFTIEPLSAKPGDHVVLTVRVDDPAKEVAKLEAVVTEFTVIRLPLSDSGQGDDKHAGDGIWSAGMDVPLEAPAGTYHLALRASSAAGKTLELSADSAATIIAFQVEGAGMGQALSSQRLGRAGAPARTQAQNALLGAAPGHWHHPLYLGNGGYWHQRIAVEVRNNAEHDAAGEPVELRIGRGTGEANLVGAAAQGVRVCDADGIEMLFRISAPGAQTLTRGPVPTGAIITLPVECRARSAATYYIYFDNPAAWVVPDFLETSQRKDRSELTAAPGRPERLQLREVGAGAAWYDDNPNDDINWACRAPIRVMNFSEQALSIPAQADISAVTARFSARLNRDSLRVTDGAQVVPHHLHQDTILFPGKEPGRTVHTYYLYFSFDKRIGPSAAGDYGEAPAEVTPAVVGGLEWRPEARLTRLAIWPVNAIVKVFRDDAPPPEIPPAWISAARNESEALQLAVRSPVARRGLMVEVDAPTNAQGARLTSVTVGVVGYVPIDYKTSYYGDDSPPWHRRYPAAKYPAAPGACDGWPGMWPDPLLPRDTFDLAPNTAQPVWITVRVPSDAAAGDYLGRVRLLGDSGALAEIPFTVHVWDFALPDETHLPAIYDVHVGERWSVPGKSPDQTRQELWRFMAEHRLCPDRIEPGPVIRYENGKVIADFADFDRAAQLYFDQLKLPMTYTPGCFYAFGWGHPPGAAFGEAPYDGEPPYQNADRSKLRPEYKRAYQAWLKAYWDHLKDKGWQKKCVLYISDEPFYAEPQIREQMKALCDMVHEVDPNIPIYSSTRYYGLEWEGYLDVWGVFQNGVVSPQEMAQMQRARDRVWFTTDSQLCSDTPYCGIERLLPHYCFHYGVEAYEFWGISWLTYDPYQFGWHSYIGQSERPGESLWVRYPNGDGFLAYPGAPIGHDGPVSSVRLEQAREGVEDFEYLYLLRDLAVQARAASKDASQAQATLEMASKLVSIPNAGGCYSSRILPDPDAVLRVKEAVARAIEGLTGANR
jgi:hypothetical protein